MTLGLDPAPWLDCTDEAERTMLDLALDRAAELRAAELRAQATLIATALGSRL